MLIPFSGHDIFFKVTGGCKSRESGADLGIALALLSSYFQQPLPEKALAVGEVSLTGVIRPINAAALCVKEAEKFGITHVLCSRTQALSTICQQYAFSSVYDLLELFPEK